MTKKICYNFIILCLIFSSAVQLYAANGTIRGTVKDKQTDEPLPYASVFLVNTSMGDAADKDGAFIIKQVPAGKYTLRATFVGYKTEEIEVNVEGGKTVELEINLGAESILNEDVIVTAQAEGQMHAINEQLTSLTVKNVVSSARIQELPDANAAESVGRLPGVSLVREGGEGSKVVIRGLSPQYNQVTIDGVQLPANVVSNNSGDQYSLVGDRATDLSMISSNMLGGIEVVKAITPDMDAAVLGGVVNFGMRKATASKFQVPNFEILSQGQYNGLKEKYDNYKVVGSYEQRYFDDSFGIFVQGSAERRNLSANEFGASYELLDKTHGDEGLPELVSLNITDVYRERERYGATAVFDYKYDSGEIGMMNFFSSSDTRSTFRNQVMNRKSYDIFYGLNDSKNKLNVISNILSMKHEFSYFNVDLKLSHTYSESRNPEDMSIDFWQDQITGFEGKDLSKVHPKDVASYATPSSTARLRDMGTSENFSRDRTLSAAVDVLTTDWTTDFFTAKLKFGGMYQYRKRSYDYNYASGNQYYSGGSNVLVAIMNELGIGTNGALTVADFMNTDYSYGNFLNGDYTIAFPMDVDLMWKMLPIAKRTPSLEGYNVNKSASILHDYYGDEQKSAVYGMLTINIGNKITLLPGVRYQNLTTSYFANRGERIPGGVMYKDTTVTKPNGYFLPMVHLRYKPFDWLQIHFAYTNTLNYPDYNTIIPSYDVQQAVIYYNNYNLKPARSENFDLVFSVFNNEVGLFAVNLFKKDIKDLIFAAKKYVTDLSEYPDLPQNKTQLWEFFTFINNPLKIDDYGIEVDWQTNFWYLPDPFSGLVLNINYTHIFSEASYPRSVNEVVYNPDGTFTRTVIDTFYTTRLLNQPNDILNMSLGYDYGGFSARLSMLYQDNIFRRPDFWMQLRVNSEKYIRWDLSVKQELPWYGIQLFFNLNNITGEDDIDINQKTSFPASQQRYGMTADLGFRIKF